MVLKGYSALVEGRCLDLNHNLVSVGSVSCLFTSSGGLGSKNETIFAVLPKPTVHLSNMSATVTKGDQLQVTCTADVIDTGDPDVDKVLIEWFKDEVKLKSGKVYDMTKV